MLDGRPLQGPTGDRGVGRYVRALARGLQEADPSLDVTLLLDPRAPAIVDPPTGRRLHTYAPGAPPGPQLFWGRLLGPRWLAARRPDVWHATFLAAPRVPCALPWVATIHDLIPLRHPQRFSWRQRWVFGQSLRLAAKANKVVAISRTTADLVQTVLGVPPARIEIVPPPLDLAPYLAPLRRGVPGVRGRYLLHLGGFDPLKGVEGLLIPAFAELSPVYPDLTLVLTGGASRGRARVERQVQSLGLSAKVMFPGHLRHEDHTAAVLGAALVVVSSREEGFGLPVIEALAAGVPVAIGPAAAAREAAGGHACLARDETASALARAIVDALDSGGPSTPAAAGRKQYAQRFAAPQVGREMLDVYRRALGGP